MKCDGNVHWHWSLVYVAAVCVCVGWSALVPAETETDITE